MISVLLFFLYQVRKKSGRNKWTMVFTKETECDFGDTTTTTMHCMPLCLTTRLDVDKRQKEKKIGGGNEGTEKDARRCLKLSVSFVFL